jgi:hypothetical protein
MKRRWVFPIVLAVCCLACVTAWVVSYFRDEGIEYWGRYVCGLVVKDGELKGCFLPGYFRSEGWHWRSFPEPLSDWVYHDPWASVICDYFGFYFALGRPWGVVIGIPLWFPSIVGLVVLWIAWRKARAKPDRRAFPIVVKGGKEVS